MKTTTRLKLLCLLIPFLIALLFSCVSVKKVKEVEPKGKYYIINCQNDTLNL